MSTIYLVRHGEKKDEMGDPALTDLGRKQAEITGKFLQTKHITALYSSPLARAKETATIIGKSIKISSIVDYRLKERINREIGTLEEFLKEWEKASNDRFYKPAGGDSSFGTGERIKVFLQEVSLQEKNILAVTHGGAIGDFLRNVFPEQKNVPRIMECSLTIIEYANNKFLLQKIGDTSHLT